MAGESAETARTRLRWAVNTSAWQPQGGADGEEWRFLAALLPQARARGCGAPPRAVRAERRAAPHAQEDAARVGKFVFFEDRKRALARCDAALQRRARAP